jgi:ParB-like chromosome segregation protein Spo0J
MSWRTIPIGSLFPAEWNYKLDDGETQRKLEASLRRNGQVVNLIVRDMGGWWQVVNGNHRLYAMRALGAGEALCYDLGEVSDREAKRVAVETNETEFPTDYVRFAEVVRAITDEVGVEELADTVPYSDAELEAYRRSLREGPSQGGQQPAAREKYSVAVTVSTKEAIEGFRMSEGLRSMSEAVDRLLDGWEEESHVK